MQKNISVNILPFLGVIIRGINLTDIMNSKNLNLLLEYYNKNHLLIIKDQNLNESQLIKASQIFGTPVQSLVPTYRLKNYSAITIVSNANDKNQQPVGLKSPAFLYHSDSYFLKNPNKATLLYSLNSPKFGGETYFVNMCFAYKRLPLAVKKLIKNKKVIYKNAYINQPPVLHPIVRIHPVTKEKSLFVNIHRALGVDNLQNDEAFELLKYLYEHAVNSEYTYKHKWCNGDLLIWHNPTTMHASTEINSSEKRLLYRILTEGILPVS